MLSIKKFPTWWLLLATGIVFFGVGLFAFADPLNSYLKMVKFTGIALLLNGGILLTMVIVNTKYPNEKKWMQAESIVHLFFGILFLLNPLLSFIALPYFIGAWMLIVGVFKIFAAVSFRQFVRGWLLILLAGGLFVFFGALLLFIPLPKANDITILLGAFGIIIGSLYIVDSYRYRKMKDTLDMLL
ncbi:MAG TPA: DUF308 domain-containing protein [Puia sp.]|nr:DUF308 domain-containing protein [Puia sp.]